MYKSNLETTRPTRWLVPPGEKKQLQFLSIRRIGVDLYGNAPSRWFW